MCIAGTAYPSEEPCFLTCLSGVRVVHVVKLHVLMVLVPCCDVRYDFCLKTSCSGFLHIDVICIYFRILVSNTPSLSDDVRVV
jgi:hypothetical protein